MGYSKGIYSIHGHQKLSPYPFCPKNFMHTKLKNSNVQSLKMNDKIRERHDSNT